MNQDRLLQDLNNLPPEAQKQVEDFIAFLQSRYRKPTRRKSQSAALAEEPFVGMWRDREDMQNSCAWVRQIRRQEWGESE